MQRPQGKIYLSRIHLSNGGYDPFGSYRGNDSPNLLYFAQDENGFAHYLRATNRERAYRKLAKEFGPIELIRGFQSTERTVLA